MSTINDGGPAFPRQVQLWDNNVGEYVPSAPDDGMTLRDYLAAHAPADPQSWFEPVMPHPKPAAPQPIRPETEDEKEDWSAYTEDMILVEQVRSPRLAGLIREGNFYRQQLRDWQADHAKQTRVQWPWAWADAMLAQRGKP